MNDKFIDALSVASFLIGLQNLELNITQEDFQQMMSSIDKKTETLLTEIHGHLEQQDEKIDEILRRLK